MVFGMVSQMHILEINEFCDLFFKFCRSPRIIMISCQCSMAQVDQGYKSPSPWKQHKTGS